MKILFHSTSSNNVYHVIGSLHSIGGGHEIEVCHYDKAWNEACVEACQTNPDVRQYLHAGRFDLAGIPRERARADADMIRRAENFRPDIQIYISAWEGLFVPEDETLVKLNSIAPLVHFCFDQSDPPWWEGDENHGNVIRYHKKGCFALQVGIDGGDNWPGVVYRINKEWPGCSWAESWRKQYPEGELGFKGLTLLTPIDPRPFAGELMTFEERPYGVAYAGNAGGEIRSLLVDRMRHEIPCGAIRLRDDHPQSYSQFARFLKMSRLVINVPFTGSGRAKHVKGRVVEAGMAGAALLEWRNPATASWFTPRYEYEEYGSIDECIDMAKWLVSRPSRLRDMAEALRARVLREHSPSRFWGQVFAQTPMPALDIGDEIWADALHQAEKQDAD